MTSKIRIAHSPDSDDAFMFYALAKYKIDTQGLEFEHILKDIQTLNEEAMKGTYEISAVSIHAYAYLTDKYALLDSGASMGEQYGPMVVSKESFPLSELKNKKIAIPGKLTSAFLALQIIEPDFEYVVVPFDEILDRVQDDSVDAGLIIHEGQLQYEDMGFKLILDLGKWWHEKTDGLPLPLGGNAVRKDLGPDLMKKLATLQKQSIAYGLEHRKDALDYALQYARDLPPELADRFVGMYVNERTLDYKEDGRKAVKLLLEMAYEKGLIPHQPQVEFIQSE